MQNGLFPVMRPKIEPRLSEVLERVTRISGSCDPQLSRLFTPRVQHNLLAQWAAASAFRLRASHAGAVRLLD